jgi:hypothetical protein
MSVARDYHCTKTFAVDTRSGGPPATTGIQTPAVSAPVEVQLNEGWRWGLFTVRDKTGTWSTTSSPQLAVAFISPSVSTPGQRTPCCNPRTPCASRVLSEQLDDHRMAAGRA